MDPSPAKRTRRESTTPPSPALSLKRPTSTRPSGPSTSTSPRIPFSQQDSHGSLGSHGSHHPPILPPPTGILSPSVSLPTLPPVGPSAASGSGTPGWASVWATNRRSIDIRDVRQMGEIRERAESRDQRDREYRESREVKDYRERRDVRSPSTAGSPGMEDETMSTETGMVFARDPSNRAPRSMMACTRCRRQKMKCDGPGTVPCRGCRQSGSQCVFEARTRPKSISVLPSRAPPFYPSSSGLSMGGQSGPGPPHPTGHGRPSTPSGGVGFYPATSQPAPPALSRAQHDPYVLRGAREPMPPPPGASMSMVASGYPTHTSHSSISGSIGRVSPSGQQGMPYHPSQPIAQIPTYSAPPRPLSPGAMDTRLRTLESNVRHLATVPTALAGLQQSMYMLQHAINTRPAADVPRADVQVSEAMLENYRSRAWPLTPWLVGVREKTGLPGLVADYMSKRAVVDRTEGGRASVEEAKVGVKREVGRLVIKGELSREDVRALGVFASWTSDPTLVAMTVANARLLGLDRIWTPRKTHDDWREWIYLSIMDRLSHLVDLTPPLINESLGPAWRERLMDPLAVHSDPAARDRDHKLLAWLEYAEILAEVHEDHRRLRREAMRDKSPSITDVRTADGMVDLWRKYGSRTEAWGQAWSARNDPILNLHYNHALLYITSPLFLSREGVWEVLARQTEGRVVLERSRDAALSVVSLICSPEVGRTLVYSYTLYRPLLSHALIVLLNLSSLPPPSPAFAFPALIGPSRVNDVLRNTWETIVNARPVDWAPGGILGEIVERGDGRVIGEAGRDLWKSFLG